MVQCFISFHESDTKQRMSLVRNTPERAVIGSDITSFSTDKKGD